MSKDYSRKAEMSVRERRAVLAVVVVAVVFAGCPSPAAALVSDLEPLKQIRAALTLAENSLGDLNDLVTEYMTDNTTSLSTTESITNNTSPVPTTSDSTAATPPNTEPTTTPTTTPTTAFITTPTTTPTTKSTTTPTTKPTNKPPLKPLTSAKMSDAEDERELDEEAVEEVRSRRSARDFYPHQVFALVRNMYKAETLDDFYEDDDPESESFYENLEIVTDSSSMAPNATQPTEMPFEPWWTRVNACLIKMTTIMTEINEGSVDYQHAAQLTQESVNMDDLVQEGSDNSSLITSEEGYDEEVYQSLFEHAGDLLKNTTKLVEEKIDDAEEKQKTERIVTIVLLSILFVVVLAGIVVAVIKPNSKRSGFKKAKRSKRAEGQDIPKDESRSVSDGGAKYVQHSFHHQYDRTIHV